ncbi:hypothetical protein GCM10023347_50030 [Streptomyces chumphonensis]
MLSTAPSIRSGVVVIYVLIRRGRPGPTYGTVTYGFVSMAALGPSVTGPAGGAVAERRAKV